VSPPQPEDPALAPVSTLAYDSWQLALAALLMLVWLPGEVMYRRKGAIRTQEDGRSSDVLGVALLLSLACASWALWTGTARLAGSQALSLAGFGVAAGGVALRYWAIATLGHMFTSAVHLRPDHRLVEAGPFRWLRHPGYAGTLLFIGGLACGLENPALAGVLVALHGLAYAYRIRVEEACLAAHFGEPYVRYAARTWHLVPFVW
jgi:protein-S-isoprenylcysteine O-methyltransferase